MAKRKIITEESFQKNFEELEQIVKNLENNKVQLGESLKQFEKGLQLAESLKFTLNNMENKIVTLKKKYHVGE